MSGNLLRTIVLFVWMDPMLSVHFRGGTFSWAPVSKIAGLTNNISIIQGYSWVRTYEFCDNSTVNTQGLIGTNTTYLQCISGCTSSGGYCNCISTDVICTDFSTTQDLSAGEKISFVSITQNAQFYLTFQNGNWLPLATAASAVWSITSYLNLVVRSDNGLLNTPPKISVLPVIHIPVSVKSVINIVVIDIDDDYTQCRWARVGGIDECGGVCQSVTGSQLLSNCSLIFTPTVTQVYYAAAIMVEDFYSSSNTNTPLSSTPTQFLIYVYNSPTSCSIVPTIIGPYPDQSCLDITVGLPFLLTVTAQIGCSSTTITDFISVSPIGMIKSPTIVAVSSSIYSISFSWIPSLLQLEPHVFCVAAIDSYNIQSTQICLKFIVSLAGSSSACPPTTVTVPVIETTTPTKTNQDDYVKYVFLGIGLLVGFVSAMISMCAIHYYVNREVCCLKSKYDCETSQTLQNLSSIANTRQAFT